MGIQIGRIRFFKHERNSRENLRNKVGRGMIIGPLAGHLLVNTPWFFCIWVGK